MVTGVTADLPDAVVRFVPAALDRGDHGLHQVPIGVGEYLGQSCLLASLGEVRDQIDDGTEDVELHL